MAPPISPLFLRLAHSLRLSPTSVRVPTAPRYKTRFPTPSIDLTCRHLFSPLHPSKQPRAQGVFEFVRSTGKMSPRAGSATPQPRGYTPQTNFDLRLVKMVAPRMQSKTGGFPGAGSAPSVVLTNPPSSIDHSGCLSHLQDNDAALDRVGRHGHAARVRLCRLGHVHRGAQGVGPAVRPQIRMSPHDPR